jgi:hypothetical protein
MKRLRLNMIKLSKALALARPEEHQKLSPSSPLGFISLLVKKTIEKMSKSSSCW